MGKCNHMFYSFIKTKLILVAKKKKQRENYFNYLYGKPLYVRTWLETSESCFSYSNNLLLLTESCVPTAWGSFTSAVTCILWEVCWPMWNELSQQGLPLPLPPPLPQAAEGGLSEPLCTSPDAALMKSSRRRALTLSAHFFFHFFFYNFIYFWLHWTFVAAQGLSLVVVLRLLTVVASLVAELRLWTQAQ